MSDNFIQIGNLEFEEIKSSLIDYLKKQEIIKDYSFEGSATQVLLDILAYNTMYQAFYMNMVANESFLDTAQRLQSVISLVKPLGYVIPGKTSATGTLKIRQGGLDTVIPRYSRFTGRTQDGIVYNFYSNTEHVLDTDGEADIVVYEGKQLVAQNPVSVDPGTQKAFLSGIDIDLRTLKVEVKKKEDEDYSEWAFSSNINTNITNESKVFFLERSELGYFLVFAGRSPTGSEEQVGERIEEDDLVRVSYIVSSGSNGNGCGNFSSTNGFTVETIYISSGGMNEPDLEEIKFFAPKWFASQDRAVTVNDCKAILAKELGLSQDSFNVFGGEELDPPIYGRVFVSLRGNENQSDAAAATEAVAKLKEKCVVSILPEYIVPTDLVANFYGDLGFKSSATRKNVNQITSSFLSAVYERYPNTSFNTTIAVNDILNIATNADSSFKIDSSDVEVSLEGFITPGKQKYHLRQPVSSESFSIVDAESSIDPDYPIVNFESYGGVDKRGDQKIRAYVEDGTFITVIREEAGKINLESGHIIMDEDAITSPVRFSVNPANSFVSGLQDIRLGVNVSNISVYAL